MYYLGIDIGGTKCAISVGKWFNEEITIEQRIEKPTKTNPIEMFELFSYDIERWIKEYNITFAGISCGGPLDSQKGVIISPPNLAKQWHGFEIVLHIEKRFGLKSKLENDANASAVAEWKFGAGKGSNNMIFMTFGTGLGAGLILDGKLYSGTNGNAGEIGHVRIEDKGPLAYGKEGSAEAFCSGGGIKSLAQVRAKEQGVVIDEKITTKDIFEKARHGDSFCLSVITESAEKFAKVVSLLVDLFNPEIIVAGGVFMRNYDLFMSIIAPIVKKESLMDSYEVCKILPAKIGENIGDYAALAIAVMEN